MLLAVALKEALALLDAQVFELSTTCDRILVHNACVEVDQMRVVRRTALCTTDTVGIVTGGTGNALVQMASVTRKAFITHYAVSRMALIT